LELLNSRTEDTFVLDLFYTAFLVWHWFGFNLPRSPIYQIRALGYLQHLRHGVDAFLKRFPPPLLVHQPLRPSLIHTQNHEVLKAKMHLFSILVATAAFVQATNPHCLSDNEASTFIEGYTDLITKTQANFNLTLATQLLASDYHSSSDGVDYVREKPVRPDSPLFSPILPPGTLHLFFEVRLLAPQGSLIDSILLHSSGL